MKTYIVYNGNGKDIIGGMAGDGYGVPINELPADARAAVQSGTYEFQRRTAVTSKFIPVDMTYYIRVEEK